MVMHRHSNSSAKAVRRQWRALVWVVVSIAIVACGSRDDGAVSTPTDDSDGTIVPDGPATPDEPDAHDRPVTADTPDVPDVPGGTPDVPDTPDAAAQPNDDDPKNPDNTPDREESTLLPDDASNASRPANIRLQTPEEQPIFGKFGLIGESEQTALDQQQFVIVSEPMYGKLVHEDGDDEFFYVPEKDFFGADSFKYSLGSDAMATVTIDVVNVNDAPSLFADVQRVVEQGSTYSAAIVGSDPDNERLLYGATNLPGWLVLDVNTGRLNGVPSMEDVGTYENIGFSVTDAAGLKAEVSDIRIEVIALNDAPTINLDQFPSDLDAGQAIKVHLFPDDPDDEAVNITHEANEYLSVKVIGGSVEIIAAEVEAVSKVELALLATDARGGVARSVVPFILHPVNGTGRGRTLHGRNGSGAGIHLVVLGDGYREDQQSRFREDVETLIGMMQADVGMSTHFSAWNIHMVETPSVDSGIDDNVEADIRDTVFNTGYFCKEVRRLICGDRSKIYTVAIDEYPNFDQILVLVNDSRYGGSGGNVAISSTESIEVALHEMGHSIAGLADEYVDQYILRTSLPTYVEGRFANVSQHNDPTKVPWKHWLEPSIFPNPSTDVGIFEGAYYQAKGFFRPTLNSLMRNYNGELGPVNSEQWALSVYARANAVLDIQPVSQTLNVSAGEVIEFSVTPTFGGDLQSIEWRLDSRDIPDAGTEQPSVSLSFPAGTYELDVLVRDISGLIRKPEPHAGFFTWKWTVVAQ